MKTPKTPQELQEAAEKATKHADQLEKWAKKNGDTAHNQRMAAKKLRSRAADLSARASTATANVEHDAHATRSAGIEEAGNNGTNTQTQSTATETANPSSATPAGKVQTAVGADFDEKLTPDPILAAGHG